MVEIVDKFETNLILDQSFSGPKFYWTTAILGQIYIGSNAYWTKLILNQISIGPIFFGQATFWTNGIGPKKNWTKKNWTKSGVTKMTYIIGHFPYFLMRERVLKGYTCVWKKLTG